MQAQMNQADTSARPSLASESLKNYSDSRKKPRSASDSEKVGRFTPGRIPYLLRHPSVERTSRFLDVSGAIIGILLGIPVLLIAVCAIKISSKGPAFFVQIRVGRGGRLFRMYKLRTMISGAHRMQAQLEALNEQNGAAFKIKNDPRLTRVGRLLRKFSIDEIPQFLNVLKGEMSLVGPRPPLPREVKSYQRWQLQRLAVKPGMTGLWQVSGRNQLDFCEWVRLDIRYIKQRSLWFDIIIMLQTFKVVFIKPNGT